MLLHIFGDTHGPDEIFKINPKRFLNRDITKDDAIVVCGDFGFPFFPTDRIPADDLKTLYQVGASVPDVHRLDEVFSLQYPLHRW